MPFRTYADCAVAPKEIVLTGHRHWRIDSKGTINTYYFAIAELQFRKIVGIAETPTGGVASASSFFANDPTYNADKAFDGNPATLYNSQSGDAAVGWLRYSFAAPRDVLQVMITAYNSGPGAQQAPTAFDLRYSDGGTVWTTVKSFTGITWAPGETKLFNV